MNFCPVCGYALPYPPADFHICPSCGTEFGYDDSGRTYEELRNRWLMSGPSWWSPVDPQPADWNPQHQMIKGLMLNTAGTFTGSQGFAVQGTNFLVGRPLHYFVVKRKRPTSQGKMTSGFDLTPLGAIAAGGRGQ